MLSTRKKRVQLDTGNDLQRIPIEIVMELGNGLPPKPLPPRNNRQDRPLTILIILTGSLSLSHGCQQNDVEIL